MMSLRPALLAALAALLLTAGLAHTSEASDEASEGGTITTLLHPGWNMVGWVGPDTLASELFEVLPQLQTVGVWDASAGAYRYAWRGSNNDLPAVAPGMGLWLYVSGNRQVHWMRPGKSDGVVIRLDAGRRLIGVVADGAVNPPDDADARAWRWDALRQDYEPYRFGDATLSGGEALWVEAAAPFNLWQPGTEPPPFTFLGDIPTDTQEAILTEYRNVRRFFAERFGVATRGRPHHIGSDVEAVRAAHPRVVGAQPDPWQCGWGSGAIQILLLQCATPDGDSLAEDYVLWLLLEIPGKGLSWRGAPALDPRGPGWLVTGARQYALTSYLEASGRWSARDRDNLDMMARRFALPLHDYEVTENRDGLTNGSERALGFFAVQWLAERASNPAVFDYFRLMRTSQDWRAAFANAFGIDVRDFYLSFAAYRAVGFLPLPRFNDDAVRPVMVFLGDVPVDTRSAMTTESDGVYTMLTERFGADPFEYTFYVGADKESLRQVASALEVGDWLSQGEGSCSYVHSPLTILMLTLRCLEAFPDILHWYLLQGALTQLAPVGSLSPVGEDHSLHEPMWLQIGTELYTRYAYLEASGKTPHRLQTESAFTDPSALQPLSSLETGSATNAAPAQAEALGFLAVEWLADHAGEPAVFEYYRVLPSSTSREAAFEQAFGLTIEDFYEQFEAYRATLQ